MQISLTWSVGHQRLRLPHDRKLSDSAEAVCPRLNNSGQLFFRDENQHGPLAPGFPAEPVFLCHFVDCPGDGRQRRPSPGQRLDDLDDFRGACTNVV
ncbi:hypothetical protein D3C78_1261570 [compost metagenome]